MGRKPSFGPFVNANQTNMVMYRLYHDFTGVFQDLQLIVLVGDMGLLPDTSNCWLRMRQECRESFPQLPISKESAS